MAVRPRHSLPAWEAVAAATGVGPGTAVLDVGCGTGGFCEVAIAAGASVSGVDVDEDALAAARRRAPAADLRAGRMEALPWGDDAFDVVVGINAFQYAQDPAAVLTEARRVTRPGGAVAICKWGPPSDNELFAVLGAAMRIAGSAPPATNGADPFAALLPAVHAAGLEVRAQGAVPVVLELADGAALEAAVLASGALAPVRAGRGEDGVRRDIRAAAEPFEQEDGSYRLRNAYRYLVTRA